MGCLGLRQMISFLSSYTILMIMNLVGLTDLTFAQQEFLYSNCSFAEFSITSKYKTNLDTLLSSLSTNIDKYGYCRTSVGQDSDTVNAVALCRGDVQPDPCRTCVEDSVNKLRQICPDMAEAIAWYDKCMVYTNKTIPSGEMVWAPSFDVWDEIIPVRDTDLSTLQELRRTLFEDLRNHVASGNSPRRKYATKYEVFNSTLNMYLLVQCTPDLSGFQCTKCLDAVMTEITKNDKKSRSKGAASYKPTCNFRYELGTAPFWDTPPPGNKTRNVIIIVVSTVIFVTLVVYISICLRKRKQMKRQLKIGVKYEVFLNFRGEDTRKGFTDFLYTSLVDTGKRTFRDDEELPRGEEIGPELVEAIKKSKISIPVFSPNYASSKWCLQELAQMVDCHTKMDQKIIPIFYNVEPSDVRNQRGSYGEAFLQHEKRFDKKIVQGWREALEKVGRLKGFDLQKEFNGHEGRLVKQLVEEVSLKLKRNYMILLTCTDCWKGSTIKAREEANGTESTVVGGGGEEVIEGRWQEPTERRRRRQEEEELGDLQDLPLQGVEAGSS